jgi:hypothetical protein
MDFDWTGVLNSDWLLMVAFRSRRIVSFSDCGGVACVKRIETLDFALMRNHHLFA